MMKFNDNFSAQCSRDITLKAIESGLISKCSNPDETAHEVFTFFETLYDSFAGTSSTEN